MKIPQFKAPSIEALYLSSIFIVLVMLYFMVEEILWRMKTAPFAFVTWPTDNVVEDIIEWPVPASDTIIDQEPKPARDEAGKFTKKV